MTEKIFTIYKDKNFLALYKPAGVLVHEAWSTKHKTKDASSFMIHAPCVVDWLVKHYPEVKSVGDDPKMRPGIVHRLDKDTSGVILVARNQRYFEYLKKLFQNHEIKKTYLALVYGKLEPKSGAITKSIKLKSGTTKRTIWKGKLEKSAATEYQTIRHFEILRKSASNFRINQRQSAFTLLRVSPKTGRTHQIRIHLSSIGHPIVGDSLYGSQKSPLNLNRQFLHAESFEFSSEDGKRIRIESELPDDLRRVIDDLDTKI